MIGQLLKATTEALSIKPFSRTTGRAEETSAEPTDDSFGTLLTQAMSAAPGKSVSEEDLFAGLIQERLKSLKGEEAHTKYQQFLAEEKAAHTKPDGFVAIEDAARAALKRMVKAELITKEEGDKIHSQAFDAAQLDDNRKALFDSRGGPGDPTMAVATLEAALLAARKRIDAFTAGTETADENLLMADYDPYAGTSGEGRAAVHHSDVSGPARPMDGADGFLFKPRSDSDGRLVVLLPASLTGDIDKVILKNRRGREVEQGMYRGIGNGEREHFRFTRPGDDYPKKLMVEVQLKNGTTKTYKIPDPAQRYD